MFLSAITNLPVANSRLVHYQIPTIWVDVADESSRISQGQDESIPEASFLQEKMISQIISSKNICFISLFFQ